MSAKQEIDRIRQDVITTMSSELGLCKTVRDMEIVAEKYGSAYDTLYQKKESGQDVSPLELEILYTKYEIATSEAKIKWAVSILQNPKPPMEELFEAKIVLWFKSVEQIVDATLPPQYTQQEYQSVLDKALHNCPYPDGQIMSVDWYLENTHPTLTLD